MIFIEKFRFNGKTYLLKDWVTVALCILQLVSLAIASSYTLIILIKIISKIIIFFN